VSEPTYRIETTYDPTDSPAVCWSARVYRVSDGERVGQAQFGASELYVRDEALLVIRRASNSPKINNEYFVTEDGDVLPAPEPQSLKVLP
jgi:hypothetical protein